MHLAVRLQIAIRGEMATAHLAAVPALAFVHTQDMFAQRTIQPKLTATLLAREPALARVQRVVLAHAPLLRARVVAYVALETTTSVDHHRHLVEPLIGGSFPPDGCLRLRRILVCAVCGFDQLITGDSDRTPISVYFS